jgi:hypothetical protein
VPVPEHADGRGNKRYQIHLKSDSGQIFVLLVNREAADSNPVAVQVPPPKEMADAMRHEVELATDAGLRYKGGGGGSFPSAAAAGMLTAGAPTVSLPAATMVKRSATEAETSHPTPPQKIFKREPEQQLLGFDFCGRGDEEGEEVLGLTGSCSSEMEEGRSSRQDFSLPSIMAAEIPGLDELMASESKSSKSFFSQMIGVKR